MPRASNGAANVTVLAWQLDLADERGEPVAVAPVDPLVGRPERGDRLAARVNVVELRSHHRRQDPAPPVRRIDADDRDAGTRHRPARHGELERERPGAADGPLALEGGMHALERMAAQETLGDLVGDLPRAVLGDRAHSLVELGEALARPDRDGH